MSGIGSVGTWKAGALDVLRELQGDGPEVEVRDHGRQGGWVQGPADVVEALAPAWAAKIGAAVRGWVVRVDRRGDLAITTVVGRRWDPSGAVAILAREQDEEEDPDTSTDDIARARLEIALDLYERLHLDDARLEVRRLR